MNDDEYEPTCECGSSMSWEECDACGGEGEHEAYEDDPLWYQPGDTEPCNQCGGTGGWWICLSSPAYHDRVMAEQRAAKEAHA